MFVQACMQRMWAIVRLSSGILSKRLDDLPNAVTHLLVRQKQLTVGIPSMNEEPITCPKTNEELKDIMHRAYSDDPNSFTLAQVRLLCGNCWPIDGVD
jgi:phosphorylase kinase alpha/beta subunit